MPVNMPEIRLYLFRASTVSSPTSSAEPRSAFPACTSARSCRTDGSFPRTRPTGCRSAPQQTNLGGSGGRTYAPCAPVQSIALTNWLLYQIGNPYDMEAVGYMAEGLLMSTPAPTAWPST